MNTSSASPPTPNLELLRKVIQEYQPNPSRVPFSNLKPFHDCIVELRGKKAAVRWMNPLHFRIIRVDRVLPASECWMAPLPVKRALARRRERFPALTNACASASARSSRRPPGFRLAGLPRYHSQQDGQTEACSSHPLSGKWPGMVHRHPPFFTNDRDTSRVNP